MNFSRRICIEEPDQRIPEAGDVGEEHRLLVAAELRPGHLLDQLLQRADAAGKRDERVRALEHQHFALMHVVGDDELGQVAIGRSRLCRKRGMMPVTVPPASSTARATVPISPTEPPP